MRTIKYFDIGLKMLVMVAWIAGFFATDILKTALWAMPAGWGAGTIMAGYFIGRRRRKISAKFSELKVNMEEMPEVKEKFKEITEILKSKGLMPEGGKCKDPHCKDCWGLAE